jgi:hypothetical protein
MKLLKRVRNMTVLELQQLQEEVLAEIHRRKVIKFDDPAADSVESEPSPAPAAEPDAPSTLPLPNRRVSRMPRRLRRAA